MLSSHQIDGHLIRNYDARSEKSCKKIQNFSAASPWAHSKAYVYSLVTKYIMAATLSQKV